MIENPKKALILGGGFDPAHKGHVNSTLYVKEQRGFDGIIFVPTGISPHKQGKKKPPTISVSIYSNCRWRESMRL